jgi:hypothetical protein
VAEQMVGTGVRVILLAVPTVVVTTVATVTQPTAPAISTEATPMARALLTGSWIVAGCWLFWKQVQCLAYSQRCGSIGNFQRFSRRHSGGEKTTTVLSCVLLRLLRLRLP